jgi:hypothetical protein
MFQCVSTTWLGSPFISKSPASPPKESSEITIRLFHKLPSNDARLGTVGITVGAVGDWLPQDDNMHCTLNLRRKFVCLTCLLLQLVNTKSTELA